MSLLCAVVVSARPLKRAGKALGLSSKVQKTVEKRGLTKFLAQ